MSGVKTDVYILAGAAQDALGPPIRPAAIHWREGKIIAIGTPEVVPCPVGARLIERPDHLVLPPFVNAHAHLDLTSIGPQPYSGDFIEWIDFVRSARPTDPDALAASVRLGIEKSIAGGTAIIGDIAGVGSTIPLEVLRADGRLRGISFVEFFGLGSRQGKAIEAMESVCAEFPIDLEARVQAGLQPHAPYSAGREVYAAAARLSAARGLPASTHLAETQAEIPFARRATGPFAEYLRKIGKWDDSINPLGDHPVEALANIFAWPARWIAAHVNYASPSHIVSLMVCRATVVHCPRATRYFQHPARGHYQMTKSIAEMFERCVFGTDSIINLDRGDRMSILDEMSLLHRRDQSDPAQVLRYATVNGAVSLGFDPQVVMLQPGPCAGLIAVEFDPGDPKDALTQVLNDPGPIEWLAGP